MGDLLWPVVAPRAVAWQVLRSTALLLMGRITVTILATTALLVLRIRR